MKPLLLCNATAVLAAIWILAAPYNGQSGNGAEDRTLHAYSRFCTPYANGWGKSALPNARPEASFLPDRPPTVSYEPYPATFVAPFHYNNPVTWR
jgi:hypothetical protein